MITNNFKNLCATMLEMTGLNMGILPVVDTQNRTYYIACALNSGYPLIVYDDRVRTEVYFSGISIGSGNREESSSDYDLQTPIFEGFSATVTKEHGLDNGDPYLEYTIDIENTGENSITINEIGYVQSFRVLPEQLVAVPVTVYSCAALVDRTVLSSPVTIAVGETKTITYRLKTTISSAS